MVITTRIGWPNMRRSVDTVLPQLEANDGQLIVVDASGRPAPSNLGERVSWLSVGPLASYELRKLGYAKADAPVVLVTEDHCETPHNWLEAHIALHEANPDAAGIFGLVENGSRDKALDWALYSAGYLAWAPPRAEAAGAPGHANLSFKTWVFELMPQRGDQILEFRYIQALRNAGYRVIPTDEIAVTHFQSAGFWPTATLFFHNGRSIAGLRRDEMTGKDLLRAALPAWLAAFRTFRSLRLARSKPDIQEEVEASAPLIAVLHLTHALGESVGYLGGPGGSGLRLH